jgi:hypothetical protein
MIISTKTVLKSIQHPYSLVKIMFFKLHKNKLWIRCGGIIKQSFFIKKWQKRNIILLGFTTKISIGLV